MFPLRRAFKKDRTPKNGRLKRFLKRTFKKVRTCLNRPFPHDLLIFPTILSFNKLSRASFKNDFSFPIPGGIAVGLLMIYYAFQHCSRPSDVFFNVFQHLGI